MQEMTGTRGFFIEKARFTDSELQPISNLIVSIKSSLKSIGKVYLRIFTFMSIGYNVISFLARHCTVIGNRTNLNTILIFAENYFKETEGTVWLVALFI